MGRRTSITLYGATPDATLDAELVQRLSDWLRVRLS